MQTARLHSHGGYVLLNRLVPVAERKTRLTRLSAIPGDVVVHATWLVLIWGVLFAPAVQRLAYVGTWSWSANSGDPSEAGSGSTTGLLSLLNIVVPLAVFAIGAGAVLVAILWQRQRMAGTPLWIGLTAFSAGPLVSSFLGSHPGLTSPSLRLPLFGCVAFVLPSVKLEWFASRCKQAIGAFTYLSLVVLAIRPSWVLERGYSASLISGWTVRLHGIGWHASGFALLLVTYLILCWIVPARTIFGWATVLATLGCLAFTQTKTMWIVLAAVFMIGLLYRATKGRLAVLYTTLLTTTFILIAATVVDPEWPDAVHHALFRHDIVTLTGRTTVWHFVTRLWSQNRLFGYGPTLWNAQMRLDFASMYGWAPTHSHSQFYQSLGQSGLVGVAGLILFGVLLIVYAARTATPTNGASLAFVAMLVIRSLDEYVVAAPIAEGFFGFFVAYAVLMLACAQLAARQSPAPRSSYRLLTRPMDRLSPSFSGPAALGMPAPPTSADGLS